MIAIIDYGAGNLFSVKNALDFLGLENKITNSAAALSAALCRAFPSCVPAFAPARPVSSPSAVSAGVLAAVTVLYIFYSGKKRDDTL